MSIRLMRIETRRNTALWLTPVMAGLAWVVFQQQYTGALGVAWSDRNLVIRDIAQPVWPLVAGAAAWMAGRRRRFPLTHIRPDCSHDPISVCVHPAFRARLPALTRTINRIAAPLVVLPGAPDRFIDDTMVAGMSGSVLGNPSSAAQEAQLRRDGWYVFSTPPTRTVVLDPDYSPAQVAFALAFSGSVKGPPTDAQEAIMMWLLRRAGFSPDLSAVNRMFFGPSYPAAPAAARRFGAISAPAQKAWLRTHYSALRDGALSLSDLP